MTIIIRLVILVGITLLLVGKVGTTFQPISIFAFKDGNGTVSKPEYSLK